MSKNVAMFVDVANMYYAARGQDVDVDYVALLKHATKGRDLIRAYAYTGLDPENENQRKFIDFLAKNGYKPVVKDIRKFGDGRMKANLDIELVVDLFRLADRMDIAVIVSGDGDFAPAIRALQDKGVRCEVISFKPNTSSDLIAVADEFMDIMKIASISRKEGRAAARQHERARDAGQGGQPRVRLPRGLAIGRRRGPRRPQGWRRGQRSAAQRPSHARRHRAQVRRVGAAAEAAERGAGTRRLAPPRRSPRATSRRAAAAVAAAAGVAAARAARTRARRPAAAAATSEIGWEELDDLSQLDGAHDESTEREYTFEEADADTLAELGLSRGGARRDRRGRRGRPSTRRRREAEAPPLDADDQGRRRRGRRCSRGGGREAEARRSTRTTKATDAEADAAPAEETRSRSAPLDADQEGRRR